MIRLPIWTMRTTPTGTTTELRLLPPTTGSLTTELRFLPPTDELTA